MPFYKKELLFDFIVLKYRFSFYAKNFARLVVDKAKSAKMTLKIKKVPK